MLNRIRITSVLTASLMLASAGALAACGGTPAQESASEAQTSHEVTFNFTTSDDSFKVNADATPCIIYIRQIPNSETTGQIKEIAHAVKLPDTTSMSLTLDDGTYSVTTIPSINSDGTSFESPYPTQVEVDGNDDMVTINLKASNDSQPHRYTEMAQVALSANDGSFDQTTIDTMSKYAESAPELGEKTNPTSPDEAAVSRQAPRAAEGYENLAGSPKDESSSSASVSVSTSSEAAAQ